MAVNLQQAVRLASQRGQPLPHVDWMNALYEKGNEIYRGSLSMFAGLPGSRKTMFAVAYAESLGLPGIYFSADSDEGTVIPRVLAHHTGHRAKQIRQDLQESDDARFFYQDVPSKIEYVFDPDPSMDDIYNEISAWVEKYDSFPELIFVDNLLDVYANFEQEHAGFKAVLKALKSLARRTNAAVIVMHHNREEDAKDSTKPAPRKSMHGRPSQTPAFVFSIASDGYDLVHGAVVKDRHGPADPEAKEYITFHSDPETNIFTEEIPLQRRTDEAWSPTAILGY